MAPTTIATSQEVSATSVTKAASFTTEKKPANVEKEKVNISSNVNPTPEPNKPELPITSTTSPQQPLKQTFPVTQSASAPPITQALQASVPAVAKPLDPKANGASQGNPKESAPASSTAAPTTNPSTLYPSPELHRKSNSPSSSKANVGPPRPTTANVAPVIAKSSSA